IQAAQSLAERSQPKLSSSFWRQGFVLPLWFQRQSRLHLQARPSQPNKAFPISGDDKCRSSSSCFSAQQNSLSQGAASPIPVLVQASSHACGSALPVVRNTIKIFLGAVAVRPHWQKKRIGPAKLSACPTAPILAAYWIIAPRSGCITAPLQDQLLHASR